MATFSTDPANTITSYIANFNTSICGYPDCQTGDYSNSTSIRRAIIKIPELNNGAIPKSALVSAATLYVFSNGVNYAVYGRTRIIYRIKREVVLTGCTWLSYGGGSWAGAGCSSSDDRDASVIGSAFWPAYGGAAWRAFSLTPSAIQEIITGAFSQSSFLIQTDAEYNDLYGIDFSANKPYMVVEYSLPGVQAVYLSDFGVM
jgi:hypothetical protein